jgi:hypothetical protein
MRCIELLIAAFLFSPFVSVGQYKTSIEQYHVVGYNRNYLPISVAHFQNNKKWYAEGRYNYEDLRTFSFYIGKAFSRKQKLSYELTPIIGGAIGNFNGISTGINVDADYDNFLFSLQSQYSLSTDQSTSNFFYNWSELAYQPLAWCYGGLSIQHTRLYNTQTTFEPGILIGFIIKNITIPLYSFAPFNKNRYFMFGLTIEWERYGKRKASAGMLTRYEQVLFRVAGSKCAAKCPSLTSFFQVKISLQSFCWE